MSSEGIDVEVPQGWDGEIFRRQDREIRAGGRRAEERPVLHVGNFALPPGRGDFGSGAVEIMGAENIFVTLFEYEPEAAGTPLFAHQGLPEVDPEHFDPATMQFPIEGQSGAQYFFNEGGRAFCLYVVVGSHGRRQQLVPELRQVLRTIRLAARG